MIKLPWLVRDSSNPVRFLAIDGATMSKVMVTKIPIVVLVFTIVILVKKSGEARLWWLFGGE